MQAQAGLLTAVLLASGFAAASAGCKLFNKEEESTAPATTAAPAPPPEPEPTATAEEADSMGNVKTYPNQIPASGMYKLLRDFFVYEEADTTSKRLGGVGRGSLIYLKATLGQWLLIEWPSGIGEMSPGWIQLKTTANRPDPSMAEEVKEPPDAGVIKDAGVVVKDAAAPVTKDGGRTRTIFRLPRMKDKK
jgi:hypothetical protein